MKKFDKTTLNWKKFERELDAFGTLLSAHKELGESKHILPFFRENSHLASGIALVSNIYDADSIAYEYDFWGKFRADLVLGSKAEQKFLFIEFEDAKRDSVFKTLKGKSTSEFSARFEHGYSQLIDWFYLLHSMQDSAEHEARFGGRVVQYEGMLIIGRRDFLENDNDEFNRLLWRMSHVVVNSKLISILTYDDLYQALRKVLEKLKMFSNTEGVGDNDSEKKTVSKK